MYRATLLLALAGFLGAVLCLPAPAQADEKEADTCIRNKVWTGYSEGWAVRASTSATLAAGEHRVYISTLYAGNEYMLRACGDGQAVNIDMVLYDAAGRELARDESQDREPAISFKPANTEAYYIVVHAAAVQPDQKAGVAMAVTYR